MSILGSMSNNSTGNMMMNGPATFHEFKKQASFFLKEKIKTARLALTDVTPAQILTEEATNGNPGVPDARNLKMISRAAFEVDDYWRIVDILHKRLVRFDKRNWRVSYKALIVLEHLLTHGPERVAEEFQVDKDVIREMEGFHLIDEKGFNWGENVRKKSERILELLEKRPLLKEERDKARKVSRGIQGFGSFSMRTSSPPEHVQEPSLKAFERCKSESNDHSSNRQDFFNENTSSSRKDYKENLAPKDGVLKGESSPLLDNKQKDDGAKTSILAIGDLHPFDDDERLTATSLLSSPADEVKAY